MLEKYARKPRGAARNKPVSTKLTQQEYKDFTAYVDSLGLTVSEALRYLVIEEVYKNQDETGISKPTAATTNQRSDKQQQDKIPLDAKKKTTETPRKTPANRRSGYLNRFKINDEWPCPLCDRWFSTKRYARHVKTQHADMSSEEFIKQNEKKALQMVENYNL